MTRSNGSALRVNGRVQPVGWQGTASEFLYVFGRNGKEVVSMLHTSKEMAGCSLSSGCWAQRSKYSGQNRSKNTVLNKIQQQNYNKLFQETRLRNRVQCIEEPITNYKYDIIDLCRVVDSTMAEETKVDYLFEGLRPSLVQKLYSLQSKTSEAFLEAAKRFIDTKLLANKRNWLDALLGVTANRVMDVPIDFIRTYPKPASTAAGTELWKAIKELQRAVESLQIQATPLPPEPGTGGRGFTQFFVFFLNF